MFLFMFLFMVIFMVICLYVSILRIECDIILWFVLVIRSFAEALWSVTIYAYTQKVIYVLNVMREYIMRTQYVYVNRIEYTKQRWWLTEDTYVWSTTTKFKTRYNNRAASFRMFSQSTAPSYSNIYGHGKISTQITAAKWSIHGRLKHATTAETPADYAKLRIISLYSNQIHQ